MLKIVSLFKNKYNTTRNYLVQRKSKRKKKSEDQIIKAIWGKIIRDIRTFSSNQEPLWLGIIKQEE